MFNINDCKINFEIGLLFLETHLAAVNWDSRQRPPKHKLLSKNFKPTSTVKNQSLKPYFKSPQFKAIF